MVFHNVLGVKYSMIFFKKDKTNLEEKKIVFSLDEISKNQEVQDVL